MQWICESHIQQIQVGQDWNGTRKKKKSLQKLKRTSKVNNTDDGSSTSGMPSITPRSLTWNLKPCLNPTHSQTAD